jgi:ATP-dependent DNA ligase
VAKRADGRYAPGRRDWVKFKRQRTADCVVIGVAGDAARPSLVLGLQHGDGELHNLRRLRISFVICERGRCWPHEPGARRCAFQTGLPGATLIPAGREPRSWKKRSR